MTTFNDDEASVDQGRPIDLYIIVTPTKTYRLTSNPVDVVYSSNTYSALTVSRGAQQIAQDMTAKELIIYLPITHELVQRFCSTGVPERNVLVTNLRLQSVSGIAVQINEGYAGALSIDHHVALLRVPSLTDDALRTKIPSAAAQLWCNHALFDRFCSPNPGTDGPDPAAFTFSTTVVSQTLSPGLVTLVIASISGNPDGWAAFGRVTHVASGQTVPILTQVGTTLKIGAVIVGATGGDSITVQAGCHHTNGACRDKFSNMVNFGAAPQLNTKINPWRAEGIGVIQQQ